MMVPFMILRGAGGKVVSSALDRHALAQSEEALMRVPKTIDVAAREALTSGVTGLTYGTFFRTTEDPSSKSGFWEKRFHQGAADMAMFGTLGFVSPFVSKSLNTVARSLESSAAVDASTLAAHPARSALPVVTNTVADVIRSPIVSGTISSIPAGLWNAEMQAKHDGRWLPTATELRENLVTMAFIGGAFGGAHSLYSRATKNEARNTDTGPTRTNETNVKEAAKSDLPVSAVARLNDTNISRTVDSAETSTPRTAESVETSTHQFRGLINASNWKQARDLFESHAVDASALKEDSVITAIKAGFDTALAKGNWLAVRDTLKFGVIPPDYAATPANKETALKGLVLYVGLRTEKNVTAILESNILTESDLQKSAELRRVTQISMQESFFGPETEFKRFDKYSWVDHQLRRDSAVAQVTHDFVMHNFQGVEKLTKQVRELNLMSDAEITAIGKSVLPKRVEVGDLLPLEQFGKRFFGVDWAQEPSLRAAAEKRVQRDLAKGDAHSSEAMSYHNLVPPEFFRSEETKKLAQEGFKRVLQDVSEPKDIAERYQQLSKFVGEIPPETIKAAASENLRKYFYSSVYLQQFFDMARETLKVEFTPEDLRKSASEALTDSLTHWHDHQARAIIDLKFLNPDDIKDAVATAIPRSIEGNHAITAHLPRAYEVDEPRIIAALHKHAAEGKITNAIRTAMLRGSDLNSALNELVGIPKLTNETGRALYERLRKEDPVWSDRANIGNSFELGVTEFGEARMLRFVLNDRVNPHDALLNFEQVLSMYKKSGMTPEAFEGKILSQVSRDAGVDDHGSAYAQLQTIAKSFPENPDEIITRALNSVPELQALAKSVSDTKYGAFADWNTLKRFGKLQHLLEQQEMLDKLDQLAKDGQGHLSTWLKTLMFHPDSRISLAPIMQFWNEPDRFLELHDDNSGSAHGLKKPSNYTHIPNLDLTPVELRDALLDGTLDKLQVFNPMRVEYDLAPKIDINKEFDLALGARREGRAGTAKNSQKLFSEVNKLLNADAPGYTAKDLVGGKEPPASAREKLISLLYNQDIGVPKPQANMRLIAELHRKSDPVAVLAGDDTVSCMGFGTGKNNIYMFNPNDAQFTVRIVNQEGKVRTFAQSVLTKDTDVKETVPNIIESMHQNDKAHVHDILSSDALRSEKSLLAADNVEVHPKYSEIDHQMALEAVYTDFFNRYLQQFGEAQNLRTDKIVIGRGYTDAMKGLPEEPNTFVPQAPVAYSDKTHDTVYRLDMDRKPQWTATPTK
ncbi:MAG: hypothetical protein HYX67_17430, partial [Candidatus Melainabacteria bacterium]|nr:hypothetical protein [Candidatus Melainabacteria bacterium]